MLVGVCVCVCVCPYVCVCVCVCVCVHLFLYRFLFVQKLVLNVYNLMCPSPYNLRASCRDHDWAQGAAGVAVVTRI